MKTRWLTPLLLTPLATALLGAADPKVAEGPVVTAMRAELDRTMHALHLPDAGAPYYTAYWVIDEEERSVEASLGAIVSDNASRGRYARVELRVGNNTYDNSNFGGGASADGDFVHEADILAPRQAPLGDDAEALRRELWLGTDVAYKNAVETLQKKRAAKQTEIAARAEVPSFSDDKSATFVEKDEAPGKGVPNYPELAAHVSAVFRAFGDVQRSEVHVLDTTTKRRFVASDGGLVVETSRLGGVEITCSGQADDGMAVERSAFLPATASGAMDEKAATAEAGRIARELSALRRAPVTEDYTGPVLFEGKAAAQLAYELLGDSLSGTPPPEGSDGLESPLSRRLGKRILPRDFAIVDDPTLTEFEGTPLLGHYHVDDEGIVGLRTSLVEDGHLKTFLMSRAPREGVTRSNGHGRSGLVGWARGQPSNLLLSTPHGLTKQALRARLLAAIREEREPFGLVVTELEPRTSATGGDVMPPAQVAYRITADGRESLLRGVSFGSIGVRDLRDVMAAGRVPYVYGFVSETQGGLDLGTSVVSPALLFEDVEVRGPTSPNKRPPVVPRPPVDPTHHP
jgi:predicted Zn-dependent protease